MRPLLALLILLAPTTGLLAQQAGPGPVKIFILAGQSNMQGQGEISPSTTMGTLAYTVANDPGGAYQFASNGAGGWATRDDVWMHYERNDTTLLTGGLTVGYGATNSTIGPELGFGKVVGDHYDNQVLLVKAAWGGKSLAVDFRPPSSGRATGFYYSEILRLVSEATTNLATDFPEYNGLGYEIVGFGWHQGWNDRVNQTHNNEYEVNMANLIRDIRSALGIPNLPFVIATTGMSGWDETHPRALSLMNAQLAIPLYPEFQGNVFTVETRDFWRDPSTSPSPGGNQAFHWNRNAAIYLDIGLAMGEALTNSAPGPDSTPPSLSSTVPLDNAIDVAADTDLVATFNEDVALTGLGTVTLRNVTLGSGSDVTITLPDSQVTVSRATLTINPTADLTPGTAYAVRISANALQDLATTPNAFSGILNDTTWSFAVPAPDTTAPTLLGTDIVDNVGGGPIFEVQSVSYTVTFSEAMKASTIDITDFGNAGSPAATINNVTATADPAVFTVSVTPGGAGTLQLQVVAAAVLEDLALNPLNTASAIIDPVSITVNAGGPSVLQSDDFESFAESNSISSPANIGFTDMVEVSFNTDNPNLSAGPVVGGNVRNDQSGFGGTYGSSDNAGTGVRVRSSNGAMLNKNALQLVSLGATSVTLSFDLKQVTANYVHVVEYSTDVGFTSPVLLDTIDGLGILGNWEAKSYTLVNGVDTTFTDDFYFRIRKLRPNPAGTTGGSNPTYHIYDNVKIALSGGTAGDYDAWTGNHLGDLSDPDGDLDRDGLTNDEERIWGLNPTSASSFNPYSVPLDAGGNFSYTRRDPTLSELSYTVWTSTDLQLWTEDTGAVQLPETPIVSEVETVAVTLSPGLLGAPELFVQVRAAD